MKLDKQNSDKRGISVLNVYVNTLLGQRVSGRKAYVAYLLVATCFVLPILIAGVDYIDDTARKLEGSYQWGSLGRVLTEFLMHIVTFNFGDMTYVGNSMQLFSIPVLALTGLVVARAIRKDRKITVSELILGVPVILNPLLLTNLSFRFDSLSMILGNLLSIVAASIIVRGTHGFKYVTSGLLIFAAAALYQSTILMFPVLVLVLFFIDYALEEKNKKHYANLLKAALVFVVACSAYFSMVKLISFSNLVGMRASFVSADKAGVKEVFYNYVHALAVIKTFIINNEALVLAVAVVTVTVVGAVFILYRRAGSSSKIDTLVALLTPALLIACLLGPFALMSSSIILQVRTLTSIVGVVLFCASIPYILYRLGYKNVAWLMIAPVVLGVYVINFSYIYGSALQTQRAYDETISKSLAVTIVADSNLYTAKTIYLGGEAGSPMTVKNQMLKRPALMKMDIAGDNSRWYQWNILRDQGIANNIDLYSGMYASDMAARLVCIDSAANTYKKNEFFTIYKVNNDTYIIWLQDPFKNIGDICTQR